jgi:hypothetical protein
MSAERQSVVKPAAAGLSGARFGMLQRKCACGGSSSKEGECEECKKKGMSLQRRAAGGGTQCLCCHEDGSTGFEWTGAHWSVNLSTR